MIQRLVGYILVAASAGLVVWMLYIGGSRRDIPLVFSPTQVLGSTWSHYKLEYLESASGRTLDKQRDFITTSEGESYTMLRAVWMGDKQTFDQSWQWTKDNLSRKDDRLSSWLFGKRQDGTYGVLTAQGGGNNASDADTDIALSLIFAYARWQDNKYLGDARVIVRDIWGHDVITINGTPYMTANNVEKTSPDKVALINVSYFAPYSYRIFATIDPSHPWMQLVDSSYALIGQTLTKPLGGSSAGLPPDWVTIDKKTGALSAPSNTSLTTNFSYDASRVPWRLALDYQWYGDKRDKDLLSKMNYLSQMWQRDGALASSYAHDGTALEQKESASMYGGAIGYFMSAGSAESKNVYETKLQYLYSPDINSWKQTLTYYDDNWAWFGIGLYNHLLPNLFASLPLKLYEI